MKSVRNARQKACRPDLQPLKNEIDFNFFNPHGADRYDLR